MIKITEQVEKTYGCEEKNQIGSFHHTSFNNSD